MTASTSVLAQSNNALALNARTSGINLCPSHDNEGSVFMAEIVLPTASEANESEAIIAALMAISAAGMISNVATVRAWTAAEFKSIAERGAKAAKAYRPPRKH